MPVRRTSTALVALAVAGFLAGCGSSAGSDDARAFVEQVRSTEAGPIKPPPEIAEYQPYTYNASDRRSPFQSLQPELEDTGAAQTGPRPNPNRPRGPLEKYALGSLTMLGTITAGGLDYALIRAPTGSIYRVTTGQYLGTNSGKILDVTPTGLVMREIVPKSTGGYRTKRTTLSVGQ